MKLKQQHVSTYQKKLVGIGFTLSYINAEKDGTNVSVIK